MLKNLVSSLKGLLPALFLNVMRRLCTLVGLALGFVDRQSHKAVLCPCNLSVTLGMRAAERDQ